jgi:hypothetical protein
VGKKCLPEQTPGKDVGRLPSTSSSNTSAASSKGRMFVRDVPPNLKHRLATLFFLEGYILLDEDHLKKSIIDLAIASGDRGWMKFTSEGWLTKVREHVVSTKHKARLAALYVLDRDVAGGSTLMSKLKAESAADLFRHVLSCDPECNRSTYFCSDTIKEVLFYAFFGYSL